MRKSRTCCIERAILYNSNYFIFRKIQVAKMLNSHEKEKMMEFKNLFEKFNLEGQLLLPETEVSFGEITWSKHPVFEGVELKHIITGAQTNGQFSFHLVRIEPDKKIGNHIHGEQLETHEVIAGSGMCVNNGANLRYEPGVVSIFPAGLPHEVTAGKDGLYLFAKFIPALN